MDAEHVCDPDKAGIMLPCQAVPIQVGFEFPIVFKIVRAVENGDMSPDIEGKLRPIHNNRGNKWWAVPAYSQCEKPEIVCCFD